MLENVWIKLNIKHKDKYIRSITKSDISLMKSLSIGFLMAEIDFYISEEYDIKNPVDIEIEFESDQVNLSMFSFNTSEINTMAIKNTDYITPVKIVLEPKPFKLKVIAFPFEKNAHYELNIQMILKFIGKSINKDQN